MKYSYAPIIESLPLVIFSERGVKRERKISFIFWRTVSYDSIKVEDAEFEYKIGK